MILYVIGAIGLLIFIGLEITCAREWGYIEEDDFRIRRHRHGR